MTGLAQSPALSNYHWRLLWLIVASGIAGVMNALAGGGSFLSFPAMLGVGVLPVPANATNTVGLWPGQLTSFAALRHDLRRDLLGPVLVTSVIGGVAGAEALLHSQKTFEFLIPWLLLMATVLFGLSGPVSKWLRGRSAHPHKEHKPPFVPLALALFPVAFYTGYFGAGGGILIMTVLALFGVEKMHQLNAMKVLAAGSANLVAIVTFIVTKTVVWHYCIVTMAFAGAGGYVGAHWSRKTNPAVLRTIVVVTGGMISAYFFWRQR